MSLTVIHDFSWLEAGFPIRIASGMTVLGPGGRLMQIGLFNFISTSVVAFLINIGLEVVFFFLTINVLINYISFI